MKNIFAVLFLSAAFLCHAERTASKTVYEMPLKAGIETQWKSKDPSAAAVDFLPDSGESGGALRIRILRKNGIVEIPGPEFELKRQPQFVTTRRLELVTQARQENCDNGVVQFRIRRNKSLWATAVRPNRFWETLRDTTGIHKWDKWRLETDYGTIGNDTTHGQLVLLVDTKNGKGDFLIDRIKVSDIAVVNHKIDTGVKWNTFFADNGRFSVKWFDPAKLKSAEIRLLNEENKVLKTIPVPAGSTQTNGTLPVRGFYTIQANAKYADGSGLQSEITAGVVGARIPEKIRMQSRYGVMRVHAATDWAKEIGSRRDWGFWDLNSIKQNPDGTLSSHFAKTKPAKKELVYHAGMTGYLPKWLQSPRAKNRYLFEPKDWDLLSKAVELWARDNPDLPDVVSIYNEPNAAWRGSEDDMVKFHNVITDAIKKGRPGTKVGGPVFYRILMQDFKRCVQKGILKNMDCVVMHAYVNSTPPEQEFIENILEMKRFLNTTPYAELPVSLTEFGWTGYPGDWQRPVSELEKARYCARSLLLCTAAGIDEMVYFNARYAQASNHYNYSIVKPDYSPLPAFVSFSTLLREMSEVKGGGQYLKLAPGVYWTGFLRHGKALAAAWTLNSNRRITLPERPVSMRSMMGKTLEATQNPELTPSPVYLSFSSPAMASMKLEKEREVLPGNRIRFSGKIIPVPFLSIRNGTVEFPVTAPLGDYTVITENKGSYTAHPVRLIAPLTIRFDSWQWDGKSKTGRLLFRITSKLPGTVSAKVSIPGQSRTVRLNCGKETEVAFELPFENGKRLRGTCCVTSEKPIVWKEQTAFDCTPFAIPFLNGKTEWKNIPAVDITRWAVPGEVPEKEASSASAVMRMYASPEGIHLKVDVRDREHIQNNRWNDMWMEDSIQAGFDFDADREWRPNDIGHGLRGHRVVQYGIAKRKGPGRSQGWCYKAYVDGVNQGPAFELMNHLQVTRNEKNAETVYEAFFPWKLLGFEKGMPALNERIGFALLINDAGLKHGRRILLFHDGIRNGKEELYGKCVIYTP